MMAFKTYLATSYVLLAQAGVILASPAALHDAGRDYATTTSPSWSYSSFSYTTMSTNRYATALPSPLSQSAFAPPFSEASTLLPTTVTYTTYSLQPTASLTDDGQYGQSAYAALWDGISYSDQPPFTTTVSPTPVASSELVFPPKLPARAMNADDNLKFPADFIWGGAASAWQIEGGLQIEGRGPSMTDVTGMIGTTGSNDSNVANMNYFTYKQDIARLAALGVPYYSFSISWTRVVPFGVKDTPVNTEALEHYDDLINTCIEYGVTPVATLLHIDFPMGIFDNLTAFPEHFLYYAKEVMTRYADRIPIWFTINEPNVAVPYESSDYNTLTAELLAHAAVYHWYKEELGGTGKVSTKFANNLAMPLDIDSQTDTDAALRYQDFILGIMANPLFLGKQFPDVTLNTPDLGLQPLTDDEIAYINGTVDFWAFDPYVAQFATDPPEGYDACASNSSNPLYPTCVTLSNKQANDWLMGVPSGYFVYIAPEGIRQQFGYVWNTFRPSGIMITEFGFPVRGEYGLDIDQQRYDFDRSIYYANFLTESLHAIHSDGVNIIGALAWSWVDNNEFGHYNYQFGMQSVNRTDGSLDQRYKRSFFDYVDFFHDHVASE
ncbi:beta-glucosidase [Xylariaceae sp. FL0016]|nr:beta-glucosidase [Xylariaceae sp. FL0016]